MRFVVSLVLLVALLLGAAKVTSDVVGSTMRVEPNVLAASLPLAVPLAKGHHDCKMVYPPWWYHPSRPHRYCFQSTLWLG